ncbi:PREDICTED: calponin-3-like [Cyprinodon variegatus]|uniref:calponin-3-like n=1 Tax=Cyprinodon variegatus TaxID=28743 RepID=UPI00074258D9|nr:PREDICTED: calponin-3-like [Cyprinodon variegatus]
MSAARRGQQRRGWAPGCSVTSARFPDVLSASSALCFVPCALAERASLWIREQQQKMSHFNKGPAYGLSAEVRSKIAQKYDPQKEEELRFWMEEVTGMAIGENFQKGLKDGVILCE